MSLTDRTYILTGATGGIGLAITEKLVSLGAKVHSLDVGASPPANYESANVTYHQVDVASRAAVSAFYAKLKGTYLDGLINCAGIAPGALPNTIDTDEVYSKIMAVNVTGVWNMTTEALPIMLSQEEKPSGKHDKRRGNIVTIGSGASLMGVPGLAVYVASKHAVLGFTRTWAKEYTGAGIRANLVAPGVIDTPMVQRLSEQKGSIFEKGTNSDRYTSMIPAGRVGQPEDIANAIAWLLSDESSYVSGQAVPVNGGSQ